MYPAHRNDGPKPQRCTRRTSPAFARLEPTFNFLSEEKLLKRCERSVYHACMGKERRLAGAVGRGYPLIEDRIQAEIMRYVRAVDRPVSRSEMTEVFGVSRSKVSL